MRIYLNDCMCTAVPCACLVLRGVWMSIYLHDCMCAMCVLGVNGRVDDYLPACMLGADGNQNKICDLQELQDVGSCRVDVEN